MRNQDDKYNPINAEVGGDADITGIAQTITTEDIRSVLISENTVEDRKAALKGMRAELSARENADRGGDLEPLITEIDNALATLTADAPTVASNESDLKTYEQ